MNRRGGAGEFVEGFADLQAGYTAAKRSGPFKRRRSGVPPMGAGADYHYASEADYLWMGESGRDLDRNDVVIGQMLDRHVDNVVGGGFSLDPNTGDKVLDKELKARATEEFADPWYCDVAGELTFYEQERMVCREVANPGDVFGLPMADGRGTVQIVEQHLCRSPTGKSKQADKIFLGVQMSQLTRRREKYFFTREPIDPLVRKVLLKDLKGIPAYDAEGEANVWHVYRPKRPTQTRGITALAPIIDAAGLHDDLQFAQLLKAQLAAFFLLVRNRDEHFDPSGDNTPAGAPPVDQFGRRRQQSLAPGAELESAKGETIQPWSPNIPNAEFFPHVKLILTFLGINLGMPLVLVLLDASETNFSGYRGAIDQARLGFRAIQQQLIRRWHRPYWRFKLHTWADADASLAVRREASKVGGPFDLFRHKWNVPGWPYIEPAKDATANLIRESNMQSSPRRLRHEQGDEWGEIVDETIEDRGDAIQKALKRAAELNTEFKLEGPAAVVWRDLAPLPAPERMSISMQVGEPDPGVKPQGSPNAKPKSTAA